MNGTSSCALLLLLGALTSCIHLTDARGEDSEKMTYEYLPSLVRLNRAGQRVSSDLSEYITFSCRNSSKESGRVCSADVSLDDFRDALDHSGEASDEDDIVSYLEV